MTLQEAYSDMHLLLPKSIPKGMTFRKFIAGLFEKYIELLEGIEPKAYNITGLKKPANLASILQKQKKFVDGLKEAIALYFDGQPAKSYLKFSETIEYRQEGYKKMLNIKEFDIGESFYRIRRKEENFPLKSSEMFHIPFEERGKVTTQRFSIPGFPSLYLGKTIYVAWEELNRPLLNNFQVARLENIKKIKVLDLTANDWGSDNLNKNAYKYLMTWPLIAASSIKVKNPTDSFKPEYIIPQLLLQWVRNNVELDGIIYNSTHISKDKLVTDGQLYNAVFPVKENKDRGYCRKLMAMFEMTSTISKQLMDFSAGGAQIFYTKGEIDSISAKLPLLELIRGQKVSYGHSILGLMEMKLSYMKAGKIT